ncbi:MAG: PAS domain S-box protein [Anaerolineales bacterium]
MIDQEMKAIGEASGPTRTAAGLAVKLLLVEDNPGDALLVRTALEDLARSDGADLPYALTVVDRLSAAIEALGSEAFQLVLLDMGLPDSFGLDTVRDLHAAHDRIPIVVLTGNQDEAMAVNALRAGAQDYLVKGQIDPGTLKRSVRHALARGQLALRLRDQEVTNQRILASLSAHIAVLDEGGRITHTNLAWDRFADRNGGRRQATGVGANYLDVCRRAAAEGDETAAAAEAAIREVLAGQVAISSLEYPCHSSDEKRWFTMQVTPLGSNSASGAVVAHEDITDRRRAEIQLEGSEKHFRSVIENASDLIAILDSDGRSTYLSPSAERMLGLPIEGLLGDSVFEYIHPDDQESAQEALQAAFDKPGTTQSFACRLVHPEKGWIDVDVIGKAEQYEGNLQVVVTGRDISQRRQMERELRRERDRFRLLAEHGPVGITLVDAGGQITYANNEAERVLGLELSEIVGRSYQDPDWETTDFDGNPFPDDQLPFVSVSETLEPIHDVRHAITWPGGERKLLSISGAPILGKDDALDSVVFAIQDITEEVRSNLAVASNERRFRSLVQNASDIITILDANRKVTYESPSLERVMGFVPEDVVGLDIIDPVYPADRSLVINAFDALIDDPASQLQTDIRLFGADGELHTLEVVGTNLLDDPAIKGIVLNSRDITERVAAKQALQDSEERYRSLFNSIRDAILVVDTDRRIIHCNPAFTKMFGYELEEIWGKQTDYVYKNPAEFKWLGEELQRMRARDPDGVPRVTVEYRGKSGDVFPGETGLYNLKNTQGEKIGAIGLIRDVTERVRHEREQDAISQVAQALRSASVRDEMPPIILRELLDLMDAGGAEMVLTNRAQDSLWVELGIGSWSHLTGMELEGNNIAWEVLQSDAAFLQDDLHQVEHFTSASDLGEDQAAIAVSMKAGEVPVGVIWVARPEPFAEADIQVLKAIADMAGNALQRAGLHEETRRRADQLATVTKLGMSLGETLELRVIFDRLADATVHLLPGASTVLISRYNPEQKLITCAYGLHDGEPINTAELPPIPLEPAGQGMQSEVIRSHQAMIINDFQSRLDQVESSTEFGSAGPRVQSAVLVPMLARGEVIGVVQGQSYTPDHFDENDAELVSIVANTAAVAIANADLFTRLEGTNVELALAYDTTLEGWARALELRDKETEGHSRRVTDLTVRLAVKLGLPEDQLVNIRRGSLLHDIGKMGIPDSILLKPGKLDEGEWDVMRTHPVLARGMLDNVGFLRPALTIPYSHHERWDGSGYPEGLTGADIPIEGRVFAVIDVYDALGSDRPYRDAWPEEKVRSYLAEEAGVLFDPDVVDAFLEMMGEPGGGH